jgi:hypothetical protein
VKALQKYAADAPATDCGEGYWDDMEEAYHCGHREERHEAAELMRNLLRRLGVEAPQGNAICGGCSQDVDSGCHDPDCTLDEGEI